MRRTTALYLLWILTATLANVALPLWALKSCGRPAATLAAVALAFGYLMGYLLRMLNPAGKEGRDRPNRRTK